MTPTGIRSRPLVTSLGATAPQASASKAQVICPRHEAALHAFEFGQAFVAMFQFGRTGRKIGNLSFSDIQKMNESMVLFMGLADTNNDTMSGA